MPHDVDAVPVLDVAIVIDALRADFGDSSVVSVGCPRLALTSCVIKFTYAQWFQPYSAHWRYYGDEKHLVFECVSLAALRAEYATTTMRSFLAQSDHLRVFHYVIDCLNMMNA